MSLFWAGISHFVCLLTQLLFMVDLLHRIFLDFKKCVRNIMRKDYQTLPDTVYKSGAVCTLTFKALN